MEFPIMFASALDWRDGAHVFFFAFLPQRSLDDDDEGPLCWFDFAWYYISEAALMDHSTRLISRMVLYHSMDGRFACALSGKRGGILPRAIAGQTAAALSIFSATERNKNHPNRTFKATRRTHLQL
jgi:hypothetical protein